MLIFVYVTLYEALTRLFFYWHTTRATAECTTTTMTMTMTMTILWRTTWPGDVVVGWVVAWRRGGVVVRWW